MDSLAMRYAIALFEIAKEKDVIIECKAYCKELVYALKENTDFLNVLSCAFIKKEEKKRSMHRILAKCPFPFLIDGIDVLIDHRRQSHLLEVLQAVISNCNQALQIQEGYVYSAFPLSTQEIENVSAAISAKRNQTVYLLPKIDADLLGGVKVVIGDSVYDGSVKNRLANLKQTLLEGK